MYFGIYTPYMWLFYELSKQKHSVFLIRNNLCMAIVRTIELKTQCVLNYKHLECGHCKNYRIQNTMCSELETPSVWPLEEISNSKHNVFPFFVLEL